MVISKDELVKRIENARQKLNESINENDEYKEIYQHSIELDQLIEEYIVAGY